MSIYANRADDIELGSYRTYVSSVRDNIGAFSDDVLMKILKISSQLLSIIKRVLGEHPDWDDEAIAEEVMMQEEDAEEE